MGSTGQNFESSDHCHLSYYATLNVPRDADREEINRAYRKLAAVFHPDKHQEAYLKEQAQAAFARVHEAYSVLTDPQRRQIYDVYGEQGLVAGVELGDSLRDPKEFKREFEELRRRMEKQRIEDATSCGGYYMCRIDLRDYEWRNWGRGSGRGRGGGRGGVSSSSPLFRAVMVQNSIDFNLSEVDSLHVQGQAEFRNNAGAGNVIFGYKRQLSPNDNLELSAVLGLQTVLSASSSRQLDQFSTATLSSSWIANEGFGLTASTSRQLSRTTTGTFNWTVGPSSSSGMSLNLQRRGSKHVLTGKLEVGLVSALTARISYSVAETVSVRAQARLGTSGVDLEVGANKRWSPESTGYMGAVVGMQGVLVKLKFVRGSQTFEIPIHVHQRYDDWRVVAAAYVIPPLTYLAVSRFIIRPLSAMARKWAAQQALQEYEREVKSVLHAAEMEQSLLAPVARRKARAEASRGGLVILEAVYGVLDGYMEQQKQELDAAAVAAAAASTSATEHEQARASSSQASTPSPSPPSSSSWPSSLPSAEFVAPPPWLRVVGALQYLVLDGRLILHEGPPKSGLMGFVDMAPRITSGKALYVAYQFDGVVYETTVADTARLVLPVPHLSPVADATAVQRLVSMGESALGIQLPSAPNV